MNVKKVLFITQEIIPYVPETPMSIEGRQLTQSIQESGREIRTFLPQWGCINERRNQLHEVIRLSGMNIIIDGNDHPLIIKVASIQAARMQVYFIDNDDYFDKRGMTYDENGEEYANNAERAIFYARGVLETVKKLRWRPDIVYCQGWISSIVPLHIKTIFKEDPSFADTRVVLELSDQTLKKQLPENFKSCLILKNVTKSLLKKQELDFVEADDLTKLALNFSDAVVLSTPVVNETLLNHAKQKGLPILPFSEEKDYGKRYGEFFESLIPSTGQEPSE